LQEHTNGIVMRKEYGKAVRDMFAAELKRAFPAFDAVRVNSRYVVPGERLFRWIPYDPLHCWIILEPHHKYEQFAVNIGWSNQARFPELTVRPTPVDPSDFEGTAALDECVVRVRAVGESNERWFELPDPMLEGLRETDPDVLIAKMEESEQPVSREQALVDVASRVAEAIALLADAGIPYLQRVAEFRKARDMSRRAP
jgi:hypothetical protein